MLADFCLLEHALSQLRGASLTHCVSPMCLMRKYFLDDRRASAALPIRDIIGETTACVALRCSVAKFLNIMSKKLVGQLGRKLLKLYESEKCPTSL